MNRHKLGHPRSSEVTDQRWPFSHDQYGKVFWNVLVILTVLFRRFGRFDNVQKMSCSTTGFVVFNLISDRGLFSSTPQFFFFGNISETAGAMMVEFS